MDKDESTSTLRYMMYVLDENLLPSKDRSKSQKNAMSSFLREWADALEDV